MTTEKSSDARNMRKQRTGIVVSNKPNKTIIVRVDRLSAHPKYHKVVTKSKRYYAHDENNEARIGDRVEIIETRPISKLKRWRLTTIVQRAAAE